jgi:hypothetical protein
MAKMTDMKRTKADKKAEREKYDGHKLGEDDYPYGLSVRLDHHSLKKLGLHEGKLPKVGSKIMLHSHAHVKSAGESSHDDGRKDRHLELELRHMHLEHGEGKNEMGGDGDTEKKMAKGMKHAIDKAVVGPEEEGSEDEDGDEA